MDKQTQAIIKDFGVYFEKFPEANVVNMELFLPVFRSLHPSLKDEDVGAYAKVFGNLGVDLSEDDKLGLLKSMNELRLQHEVMTIGQRWEEGSLPNIHASITEAMSAFEIDTEMKVHDFIRPDLQNLLESCNDDAGILWRLQCLRESMRALRGGDFGIIAARPDKGKTTFLAGEVTYMAAQLPKGRNVVWLNNEGPGDRIYLRLVQAALGKTLSEIREIGDKDAMDAYSKLVGHIHRIRVVDIHGMDTYAVENILRVNNAGIAVYDMIDHIKGFGGESRTDQVLEQMYQWARNQCVKNDMIGLATSQISVEGDGLQFPTMSMLKDSKTGKQGACEFQLMIGSSNDPNLGGLRYMGLPKNKARREGTPGDPRATVNFKPQIARYEDLPISGEEPDG